MTAPCDFPGCAASADQQLSCCPPAPVVTNEPDAEAVDLRIIGLDIHRAFAEAVAWQNGKLKRLGRIIMRREDLAAFARRLSREDIVVVKATGNAASVAAVLTPHVKKVMIANPRQVRLIAHATIKTDTIDAGVLAKLYASGFLPEVWIGTGLPAARVQAEVVNRAGIFGGSNS